MLGHILFAIFSFQAPATNTVQKYRWILSIIIRGVICYSSSSSVALQPGVDLGLLYNTPPGLSIPCSVSPFVYSHLYQVRGHVIQPSHFWYSSSPCCIQLSVQHLFLELRCLAFFLCDQAIIGYLRHLPWLQHGLNIPCAKCQIRSPLSLSGIHYVPRLIVRFRNN